MDKNIVSCDLCGSKNNQFLFSNNDRMFPELEGYYNVFKCKNCGLIFLNPQPNFEDLSKHYNSNYSVLSDSDEIRTMRKTFSLIETLYHHFYSNKTSISMKLCKILFHPLKPFFRTTKVVKNGNFLDVGCAVGYFLLTMKYLEMNPYGVEPGNFDKKFSEDYNLNIFQGNLFEAEYDNNFFDIITLNHVLEHVNNPSETIMELRRVLKPGGHLIISVPVSDSLAFKIFGKYWAQLDTPRHLFIFSTDNLKKYAEKAGFEVENVRYNSTPSYQFISSFIYLLEHKKGNKFNRRKINNLLWNLLLLPVSSILNLISYGDQCEIILKKNN